MSRSDLQNPNVCASRGINYWLLEVCFASSADDMATFDANIDVIARGILAAFGIVRQKTEKEDETEDGMISIYKVDGRVGEICYDGTNHHEIASPAEKETIKAIYKEWAKKDMPEYTLQPDSAAYFIDLTIGGKPMRDIESRR